MQDFNGIERRNDRFAAEAAKILGKPIGEVTPKERADAKRKLFWLIYGVPKFGRAPLDKKELK